MTDQKLTLQSTVQSTEQPKRQRCPRCDYVQKNCLCAAIKEQACRLQIIILQHPTETKHSKNSAKLVKLCIKRCTIVVGEHPEDFAQIKLHQQPVYLIYPSEQALSIEDLAIEDLAIEDLAIEDLAIEDLAIDDLAPSSSNPSTITAENQQNITLIFIDASWRKAYKMWQQNPWLQQLPNLTFNNAPKTRYQIRKHKRETSLSTLEAVAYCLSQLENTDTSALFEAFDAMIAMHNRYRPQDHHNQ